MDSMPMVCVPGPGFTKAWHLPPVAQQANGWHSVSGHVQGHKMCQMLPFKLSKLIHYNQRVGRQAKSTLRGVIPQTEGGMTCVNHHAFWQPLPHSARQLSRKNCP